MRYIVKHFVMLFICSMMLFISFACSRELDDSEVDGEYPQKEITYENLAGEWICFSQHYEEGGENTGDEYYNTDRLSLTFNEDQTGHLRSETNNQLLEIGGDKEFTYQLSGGAIYNDIYGYQKWIILSLTEKNLTLKYQDEDFIIIAKFVKRADLNGKISKIIFLTEYDSGDNYENSNIEFSYDFMGELNGINKNGKKLIYLLGENNKKFITWYDGVTYELVDNKSEDNVATLLQNNMVMMTAEYSKDGYLDKIFDNKGDYINFKYLNGNLLSYEYGSTKFTYDYSNEKNDANIDLNYFINKGDGYSWFNCSSYMELGLSGKKSNNLISQLNTPEDFDFYYTYAYERDGDGRISKIIKTCKNRYDKDDILNKCTIEVKYYSSN